jgi:hypothetical protein
MPLRLGAPAMMTNCGVWLSRQGGLTREWAAWLVGDDGWPEMGIVATMGIAPRFGGEND